VDALRFQTLHPASIPEQEVVRGRNTPDGFVDQADQAMIFRYSRNVRLRIPEGQNLLRNELRRIQHGDKHLTVVRRAVEFSETQAHED
jgi:hypothetical protein